MSVHVIYYKDGAKMMRPVLTREEYLTLRGSNKQQAILKAVHEGEEKQKHRLVQMNYSCLPNEDGSLKGSTQMSTSVGMDIDHVPAEEMQPLKERILAKAKELGLLMLEKSARGEGFHLVFRRREDLSQEENLQWASDLLGVKYDEGAKDITRVFFTTTADEEHLIYLSDDIFEIKEGIGGAKDDVLPSASKMDDVGSQPSVLCHQTSEVNERIRFIAKGVMKEKGLLENDFLDEGGRHTSVKMFLSGATQLLKKEEMNGVLKELMPEHWNDENIQTLVEDFYQNYTNPNQRLLRYQENLFTQSRRLGSNDNDNLNLDDDDDDDTAEANSSLFTLNSSLKRLPQGIRDSIDAVGPQLAMPVVTAICPCIGTLATGVTLDVHGQKKGLNLISYIAGDFASGKGQIDPVVDAWMSEVRALDKMYQMQEDEWRAKKRAAKNKKEQPEEPKLPVRCLTLNNTVANLAERLANTEGKHAFSFTPEADTVAQKWKSTMSDFSVMLRQSYDGTKYEREARSADAVNVHIERLLWNVCMCGTPDALYRVVNNYTDGFQSRIAIARTPDNTFAPLEDKPYVLTDRQTERIQQIAHLLPLMQGEVVLPKLEAKGREWVERIRIETMMNDDKVRARQRFRVCVTAQRMTCCLMLCKVCEQLIQKYGLSGAESRLKQFPNLWKEMLLRTQTPQMLEVYDVIADSLLENALHFFRDRIENAFNSRDYAGYPGSERMKRGKNDSIYERLDVQFTFEQAMQQSIAIKGANVTHNTVRQMLKNWRKQGLVVLTEDGRYRKVERLSVIG